MMAWVASVVWVMWQTICGVVTDVVRKENGCGGSSPCCTCKPSQSMVRPSRRGGVPVLRRPMRRPKTIEPRREAERRRLVDAPGRDLALADMDQAAQEGAGGEHHGAGAEAAAVGGDDAGDRAVLDDQVLDRRLDHCEVRRGADRGLHRLAIELAVGLGAGPLHRRPLAPVQDAKLDAGGIGHPRHQAIERVDLADEMPLAEAADGRIAGHLADGGDAVGDERGHGAHARSRGRGLAAGMAAADDDDVEIACRNGRSWPVPKLFGFRRQSGRTRIVSRESLL